MTRQENGPIPEKPPLSTLKKKELLGGGQAREILGAIFFFGAGEKRIDRLAQRDEKKEKVLERERDWGGREDFLSLS